MILYIENRRCCLKRLITCLNKLAGYAINIKIIFSCTCNVKFKHEEKYIALKNKLHVLNITKVQNLSSKDWKTLLLDRRLKY